MSRIVLALACLALSPLAYAADFIVDTTSDAVLDACDPNIADDCSLRGAITAANAGAAADSIQFALPESDPGYQATTAHWRIAPATALPDVQTGPLTIDGFTQAGAAPNTNPPLFPIGHTLKIELRGPNPSTVNCLQSNFVSLTVRGLALNNCSAAIFLFDLGTQVVEGNYIGTDITGQTAVPNRFGVALGGDVRIGGIQPSQGNVISGNSRGALVQFRQITRLRVQGNIIGPNNLQTAVPGIQDYGVQLLDHVDAVIGGTTPAEANVISGNAFNAISVSGSPQPNAGTPTLRVIGNIIGATFSGAPMGNGLNPGSPSQVLPAIQIGRLGYCRTEIGGTAPGEGNLIAHSGGAGVAVNSCWSAPILGNSFLTNRSQPIDLATTNSYDGPTPNDPGDGDGSGIDPFNAYAGNRLQNTAEVVSLVENVGANELRLTLRVDSTTAASAYPLRIDFYRTDEFGIQSTAVTASYDAVDAQLPREYLLTLSQFASGGAIAVTDAEGNSSELLAFGDIFSDGFE